MSKSAVQIARETVAVGRAALPGHGRRFLRRDYTQPQLSASRVARQFLHTDYPNVSPLPPKWSELRQALGPAKMRHYSTVA